MERTWDVFAVEGPANRTVIAQFGLQGGQLTFHWLDKAKDVDLAGMLENCLLQITINEQKAAVALRQPLMVKPLVLDLDRGNVSGKCQIPNSPDPANCRFEITGLDGPFPKHALFPPDSVPAAKGEQWILLGEQKAEQLLALHVESTMKRVHQVTITALSQHGDDPDATWLKDKTRRMVKSQRNQRLKELQADLAGLAAAVQQFDAADATKLTDAQKQTGNAAKARLERDSSLAIQLQKLEELCKELNDVGKVHFRVVYEVEGHPIELLRTQATAN
jgi:hypothetical protein